MRRQHMQQHSETLANQQAQPQPICGSIIDDQGREVAITPEMIKQACEELEKSRVALAEKN
ncbi:hypothetical protein BGP80_19875 [Pseudomonas putida]|uniref:Multifunctional fatty acid oxidation complex subunit alpha n=2 Tax=Pseudomonas TaxID=286 RepID=A0A2S3WJF9_PSEPU|nr:hypothetical protein BGP80_19875 [Pseudomonas putida]